MQIGSSRAAKQEQAQRQCQTILLKQDKNGVYWAGPHPAGCHERPLGLGGLGCEPAVTEQGGDGRVSTSESTEGVGSGTLAPHGQNLAPEAMAGIAIEGITRPIRMGIGFFLKGRVGIGRQDFGPFVAVVTRAIATRKQVRELMREAVPLWRKQHGHFLTYLIQNL